LFIKLILYICTMRLRITEYKKEQNKTRIPGQKLWTNKFIGRYVYFYEFGSDNAKAVRVQRQNKGHSDGVKLEHLFRYMELFGCTADELIEFDN
jgi:hypothetical protein